MMVAVSGTRGACGSGGGVHGVSALQPVGVGGTAKVRMDVGLGLVVMLAGARAQVEAGKADRARQIVRLAA